MSEKQPNLLRLRINPLPKKERGARLWAAFGVESRLRLRSPWKPLSPRPLDRVFSPSPPLIGAGYASGRSVGSGAGLHFRLGPTRMNVLTSRWSRCPDAPRLHPRRSLWSWGLASEVGREPFPLRGVESSGLRPSCPGRALPRASGRPSWIWI